MWQYFAYFGCMNVLNEDKNLIQNHFFDANLGKFSRYERLNTAITNFSWSTCLLTSSDHDIIPMAYHSCMFVLNCFAKQICNVEALICHFYKKTSKFSRKFISLGTLIYFVHALFLPALYLKGLHQMRKDLVLSTLHVLRSVFTRLVRQNSFTSVATLRFICFVLFLFFVIQKRLHMCFRYNFQGLSWLLVEYILEVNNFKDHSKILILSLLILLSTKRLFCQETLVCSAP